MNGKVKRIGISIAILIGVYFLPNLVISPYGEAYNYVKAVEWLAAVIAAGCYWIGSNEK